MSIFKENVRIIAVVELEKRMSSISIFNIVVYKFPYGQKPCQVVLVLIEKSMQICLNYAILLLGLAVCLQLKCSTKFLLYMKKVV